MFQHRNLQFLSSKRKNEIGKIFHHKLQLMDNSNFFLLLFMEIYDKIVCFSYFLVFMTVKVLKKQKKSFFRA